MNASQDKYTSTWAEQDRIGACLMICRHPVHCPLETLDEPRHHLCTSEDSGGRFISGDSVSRPIAPETTCIGLVSRQAPPEGPCDSRASTSVCHQRGISSVSLARLILVSQPTISFGHAGRSGISRAGAAAASVRPRLRPDRMKHHISAAEIHRLDLGMSFMPSETSYQ